jgi:hypothetical protein
MLSEDLQALIRTAIRTTWALELILLLRAEPERRFTREQLAQALRATPALIDDCVARLARAALVVNEPGAIGLAPLSPALADQLDRLAAAYAERPLTVINAIIASPNDRLKSFADAFRIPKGEE